MTLCLLLTDSLPVHRARRPIGCDLMEIQAYRALYCVR